MQAAFSAGDIDRAMWTLRLLEQHPCAARDAETVKDMCSRIWPAVFGSPWSAYVARLGAEVSTEVARLVEQAKTEPAPKLFLVPSKPAKDLPS